MESKVTQAKEKKEQLFMQSKHSANRISAETQKQSDAFAADYMGFLNASKTEREAAKNAAALLEEKGFVSFTPDMKLQAGDKIYVNNRGKAIIAAVIKHVLVTDLGRALLAVHKGLADDALVDQHPAVSFVQHKFLPL